jgi:hypothetical protein
MSVKFLWATAPDGQVVKIPLTTTDYLDTVEIAHCLNRAAIPPEQFEYVVFSTSEPAPNQIILGQMAKATAARKMLDSELPPIPKPNTPDLPPDRFSTIGTQTKVAITDAWRNETRLPYAMKDKFGSGYFNVLDIPKDQFRSSDGTKPQHGDYELLHNGQVQLCYGPIWRLEDWSVVDKGEKYTRKVVSKHGISNTDELSVSATLGFSGGGATASLTVAFKHSVTVTSETTIEQTFEVTGQDGLKIVYCVWQLCNIFTLEVGGIRRQADKNPFLIQWDSKGLHYVRDTFDGTMNADTLPPAPNTTEFPNTTQFPS